MTSSARQDTTAPQVKDGQAFNPFDPDVGPDRYEYFKRLRTQTPIGTAPGLDVWYVTRFADCEAILRHPDAGSDSRRSSVYRALAESGSLRLPATPAGNPSLMFLDPPDHTRLRKLVSKAFAPRIIEGLRPMIEEVASALLDDLATQDGADLIPDYAYPLVFRVMAKLIGVPPQDQDKFLHWSNDMSGSMDMRISDAPDEAAQQQAQTMREGQAYLLDLVESKRRSPGQDLLSELIKVEEDGDLLGTQELLSTALLLVGAGTETTVHLIGNCLLALLTMPDQRAMVEAEPELIKSAVEETLRWDPPTQVTQRIALADIPVEGGTIPAGCPVILVIAAANRDPEKTPHPDGFDLNRGEFHHLSFALGRHYCLGNQLARMEAQLAVRMILQRFPRLRLAAEGFEHRDTFVLRCLDHLHVTW